MKKLLVFPAHSLRHLGINQQVPLSGSGNFAELSIVLISETRSLINSTTIRLLKRVNQTFSLKNAPYLFKAGSNIPWRETDLAKPMNIRELLTAFLQQYYRFPKT
jgi:hypothetical protein